MRNTENLYQIKLNEVSEHMRCMELELETIGERSADARRFGEIIVIEAQEDIREWKKWDNFEPETEEDAVEKFRNMRWAQKRFMGRRVLLSDIFDYVTTWMDDEHTDDAIFMTELMQKRKNG